MLPSSRTPSPNSPVNKFIYSPRQDSPVSPAAQCAKVAPLLPPNKKSLMNHFSNPHEKENGTDENHVIQQPNDYQKECGTFAQQRQRLKSAQVRHKKLKMTSFEITMVAYHMASSLIVVYIGHECKIFAFLYLVILLCMWDRF